MAIEYNFKYMPLVGKLSGESMVKQTETAINEIAKIVNDNTAQAEIINTLAEQANANSVEALEKATEALDTSSRVYLKETLAVNLNNYCESQLLYINNVYSQNLPVAHKGFLEVKTNDDKTQATQVFADDVDRKFYVRTGAITATTVGDVTTYTASYGDWVDIPNITDLDDYLALAGGTMSGDIEFSASEWKIKGSDIDNDAKLSIVGATDNLNGSSLNLYGRNHTESGAFELNANNGTYTKTLKGTATGNLIWDGNVTADNFIGDGATITGTASVDGQVNVDGVVSVENGSNTAVNTLQRNTAYAVDDIVYTSEINARYYLLCTTAGTTASTLPSFANVESNTQITDGTVVWRVQTVTSQEKAAGFPIGFEYFSMNPNVPQGSLPLFGGEYSRATYADLWAWVQEQSGYLKTEADWQDLATANNGNVPYYSNGDGSTTFRVPSLKCWIKGANGTVTEVGSYLEAGLPNITGSVELEANIAVNTANEDKVTVGDVNGAFTETKVNTTQYVTSSGSVSTWEHYTKFNLDASKSNSIYGNSSTVQPESIVGMWLVKAYGTVVDTGQIDEQQYIDDRIAALPTSLVTTFVPYTGGTMKASLRTTPHVMEANYSGTVGNLEGEILNAVRYGKKGTPSGYQEYYTFAVARDNDASYTDTQPECRYATIEGHVNENGYASLEFRAYKNEADSTTNTSLVMGYGIGSSATEQYLQFADKRLDVSAIGTNYIRYGNGIQIVWGVASSVTSSGKIVTYPVAFTDSIPAAAVSVGSYSNYAGWSNLGGTYINLRTNSTTGLYVAYVIFGHWK